MDEQAAGREIDRVATDIALASILRALMRPTPWTAFLRRSFGKMPMTKPTILLKPLPKASSPRS